MGRLLFDSSREVFDHFPPMQVTQSRESTTTAARRDASASGAHSSAISTTAPGDIPSWLATTSESVGILESLATIAALVVGAWWVLRRRKTYPRAKFTHSVAHVVLNSEVSLLRLSVAIENVGDVLLRLDKSVAGVQQVSPVPSQLEPWLAARTELLGSAITEFDWPFLDSRQRNWSGHEVEPGEAVAFDSELLVPAGVRHVVVYSYFRNVTTPGDIGWNTSTIYEIRHG